MAGWLLVVVTYFIEEHSQEVANNRGETLHATAIAAAQLLSTEIEERSLEIALMADAMFLLDSRLASAKLGEAIQLRKTAHSEYVWIGIADAAGQVVQASDGILLGASVMSRPWFRKGIKGHYAGDVHEAALLAKFLSREKPNQPIRFIDFASPISDRSGKIVGVLGAHASWDWVTDVVAKKVQDPHADRKIELLILNSQGDVLYPFANIGTTQAPALDTRNERYKIAEWAGEGEFLSSQVPVKSAINLNLDWYVVAREPKSLAYAPVRSLRVKLVAIAAFFGAIFLMLAYSVVRKASRPIEDLANAAMKVSRREKNVEFPDPKHAKSIEISQLCSSFRSMINSLLEREAQLETLNVSLEAQVRARTHELTIANVQLAELAVRDSLTGLSNRRHFDERLTLAFQQMHRSGLPYHILMVDVDHFKKVNDSFGHDIGDQVLRLLAQILSKSVRETDMVARYGGEEFVVLLADAEPQHNAVRVGEKIRRSVEESTFPKIESLTISIGLGTAVPSDASPDVVLQRADSALYSAKKKGRNCVQVG